jgi:hypothetical protein
VKQLREEIIFMEGGTPGDRYKGVAEMDLTETLNARPLADSLPRPRS